MNSPELPIIIAPAVHSKLGHIWQYNARKRGISAANSYDEFLRAGIDRLAMNYWLGIRVTADSSLSYMLLKKRGGGDGHVLVFRVSDHVRVLDIFHTKEEWRGKL